MSLSCREKMGRKRTGDSHLFCTFCAATNCDKLSDFDLARDEHIKLKIYATKAGKRIADVLREFVATLSD